MCLSIHISPTDDHQVVICQVMLCTAVRLCAQVKLKRPVPGQPSAHRACKTIKRLFLELLLLMSFFKKCFIERVCLGSFTPLTWGKPGAFAQRGTPFPDDGRPGQSGQRLFCSLPDSPVLISMPLENISYVCIACLLLPFSLLRDIRLAKKLRKAQVLSEIGLHLFPLFLKQKSWGIKRQCLVQSALLFLCSPKMQYQLISRYYLFTVPALCLKLGVFSLYLFKICFY